MSAVRANLAGRSALLGHGLLTLSMATGLQAGWSAVHGGAIVAVLAHVVSACCAGGSALVFHPERRDATAIGAALMVLCVPGVGLLGFVLVALPSWGRRPPPSMVKLVERALPSVREELAIAASTPRLPPADALDSSSPLEARVGAVRALRHVEASLAVPLLRTALGDPSEDVRLLAHAVLDRRERALRVLLDTFRERLAELERQGADDQTKAPLHAAIASQLWLLHRAGFVASDARKTLLEQTAEHARLGCAHALHRGSVAIAIQAFLELSDRARAREALVWAEHEKLPASLLAPLWAALAYREHRYDRVRDELRRMPAIASVNAEVALTLSFWSRQGRRA